MTGAALAVQARHNAKKSPPQVAGRAGLDGI